MTISVSAGVRIEFLPSELRPFLAVEGLFEQDVPAVVGIIIAENQEGMLKGFGAGARQADADYFEWLCTLPWWWGGNAVDVVFEEVPVPAVQGGHDWVDNGKE